MSDSEESIRYQPLHTQSESKKVGHPFNNVAECNMSVTLLPFVMKIIVTKRTRIKGINFAHFLMGGTERRECDICVARAYADSRHTNDTHAFPQTTWLVVSKSRLIASSARHLLTKERKKTYPHLDPPIEMCLITSKLNRF